MLIWNLIVLMLTFIHLFSCLVYEKKVEKNNQVGSFWVFYILLFLKKRILKIKRKKKKIHHKVDRKAGQKDYGESCVT